MSVPRTKRRRDETEAARHAPVVKRIAVGRKRLSSRSSRDHGHLSSVNVTDTHEMLVVFLEPTHNHVQHSRSRRHSHRNTQQFNFCSVPVLQTQTVTRYLELSGLLLASYSTESISLPQTSVYKKAERLHSRGLTAWLLLIFSFQFRSAFRASASLSPTLVLLSPASRPARRASHQGRNHWGVGSPDPPKIWTDHPSLFDEECDYRYVTDCSARNWYIRILFCTIT